MSYLVFARKWRPQNFDEVIGQEHIATTLKNAISLNRVAHAYLFSGPRGIGKTSTARIFAKALNCEKGPAPSPCNVCESCQEISGGRSLDVIEIDGASNRGIEQIRQLRESVQFAPAKGRFKVYIIDEVHQITTDGFNAILKTLEEPPGHVKFILATTQAYKVLPTILSRCQRFDFRPLSVSAIVQKLKRIAKEEKLDVAEEALVYIARQALGSMRDAESILDQLTSFCKAKIKLEQVTSMLGMIDFELLWQIAQKIIDRDTAEALTLVEKIINEGKELFLFVASLMEHFRHILITKVMSEKKLATLIDLPEEYVSRICEQGKKLNLEDIFYIFNVLVRAQENLRRSLSSRVIVEMAIVRLAQRENISSLEEILTKLANLEQKLPEMENPGKHNFVRDENQIQIQNDVFHNSLESPPAFDNPNNFNDSVVSHENHNDTQRQDNSTPIEEESKSASDTPFEEHNQNWIVLLQAIQEEKIFLASSLQFGKMLGIKDGVLTVSFPERYKFYHETLEHVENKKIIEAKAKEVFGRNLRVKFTLEKDRQLPGEEKQKIQEQSKELSSEPIVQSALKIFQGRIIRKNGE